MQARAPLAGFDAAADRYDDDERPSRVFAHLRARAFEALAGAFPRGARLVEVGSGTGTEAARLARDLGCRVALVDLSERLLDRARAKVRAVGADHLLGAHALSAARLGDLTRTYGEGSFDGAYSSLGPLNCVPALAPVAEGLAALVRPGGAVVVSVMNRWCPFEVAWFLAHGQIDKAARRWGGPVMATAYPGGPADVATWYYSRRDVERAFSPRFAIEHAEALPLLWPPTYLDFVVARFEPLFRALEPVERWAAPRLLLRDLGDHVLLRMRRR